MELTFTYLEFVHGTCLEKECPVCQWWTPKGGSTPKTMAWNKKRVTSWLQEKGIKILPSSSKPASPWWLIDIEKDELYEKVGQERNNSEKNRKIRKQWATQIRKNKEEAEK